MNIQVNLRLRWDIKYGKLQIPYRIKRYNWQRFSVSHHCSVSCY